MKKLIYLAMATFLITSCEKEPDYSDFDNDYLVYTSYDKATDFGSMSTYFIPDSLLIIGDAINPIYWKGPDAEKIINAYIANMTTQGYTRIKDKEKADLGIQLSYVEDISYFTNYDSPYWWWDYPGYWTPGYWGDWNYWYYPYPVVYSYSVGSLLCEFVNLNATEGTGSKLPVVWTAFMSGLLTDSSSLNLTLTVSAVNQSFKQSPYILKK